MRTVCVDPRREQEHVQQYVVPLNATPHGHHPGTLPALQWYSGPGREWHVVAPAAWQQSGWEWRATPNAHFRAPGREYVREPPPEWAAAGRVLPQQRGSSGPPLAAGREVIRVLPWQGEHFEHLSTSLPPSRPLSAAGREVPRVLPPQVLANQGEHFGHGQPSRRLAPTNESHSVAGEDVRVPQLSPPVVPIPPEGGSAAAEAAMRQPPPKGPPSLEHATATLFRATGDMGKGGAPDAEKLRRLLAEGRVLVCEASGPYAAEHFHRNVTGASRGYSRLALWEAATAKHDAALARLGDWSELDPEHLDDIDADQLFSCGMVKGRPLDMGKVRPRVRQAQAKMRQQYGAAYDALLAQPEMHGRDLHELATSAALSSANTGEWYRERVASGQAVGKVGHHDVSNITELCAGALKALPELWAISQSVLEAGRDAGGHVTWGLKKPRRIWFKLNTK